MLLKTYQKIIDIFTFGLGYASFADLREQDITISQIKELEMTGAIRKFARGWYWSDACGFNKPVDHKYIEIAKVNPRAVICMESACYLNGLLEMEPSTITVATERTDRKQMQLDFSIRRYYLQKTGISGEIREVRTDFGTYRYYSTERTICDCARLKDKIDDKIFHDVIDTCLQQKLQKERIYLYAKELRAIKNVKSLFV